LSDSSESQYPGLKDGHFVKSVEENGAIVVLEDGARFEVYSGFQFASRKWQPQHMIKVKFNRKNADYPYKLINIHQNDSVETAWRPQHD